jgi:predicted Rossmann-fold nucleotide-binding protein
VNTRRFFDPLIQLLRNAVAEQFMNEQHLDMWQVVETPDEVPAAIEAAPRWSGAARDFAAVR